MNKEEILAQIRVLRTELDKLERVTNKHKKFEFDFPYLGAYIINSTSVSLGYPKTRGEGLEHGRYRLTQQGANLSLERNKRANRLEMLVEYLGGLVEFDVLEEKNWYVTYNAAQEKWFYYYTARIYDPEKVYMTEEVARKVTEMLNNKEYEL